MLIKSRLLLRRCNWFNRPGININASWLDNTHSINLLWLNNEDSIRKRLLALSTRKLIREDLNLNTKDTLTKENVTGSRIDKVTNL
jgi:hypothetical protein